MNKAIYSTLGAAAFLCSYPAMADIRFNGFASMYMGQTFDDDETLYGYDNDISFKNESLFGIQATADLTEGLSATAQIVAKGRDDFEASFEWAYLTLSLSENWDLSAGRIRIPFFKYSEYLDVGFAHPWGRTPRDVYENDFNTMEGLRLNYSGAMYSWDVNWQFAYGALDDDVEFRENVFPSEFNDLFSTSLEAGYDWFSFRVGYTWADATVQTPVDALKPFFDAFNPALFDELQAKDDHGYFGNIGFFIDYNDWLLNSEVIKFNTQNSINAKTEAFYVMAGKRIQDFVFSYTYSEREDTNDRSVADQIPEFIPTPNPLLVAQCGTTGSDFVRNCTFVGDRESETHIYTVRWNFHPSAALTVDYTDQKYTVFDTQPADIENKLVTLGIDLVF